MPEFAYNEVPPIPAPPEMTFTINPPLDEHGRMLPPVDVGAKPYTAWVKADLESEVDRRNEGRDAVDLLVPESTKNADLIAALEADDAANDEGDN